MLLLGLAALVATAAVMAQRPPVLARAAIAGEVVTQHLIEVGQMVKQELVYVRATTRGEPALAALAPVDGWVTRVTNAPC